MNTAWIIQATDFLAAFLFIYGLKRMSSPVTARSGIRVAGYGMLLATVAGFLYVFGVAPEAQPHLAVNFGCTGGQHRSVYCAETLAIHLREHFQVGVRLIHREIGQSK